LLNFDRVLPVSEYLNTSDIEPNQTLQLYGVVKPQTLKLDTSTSTYSFKMTDFKADVNVKFESNTSLAYEFKEGESIVLFGYYRKKKCDFIGTTVQTNHSLEEQSWDQKNDYKNRDY